MANIDDKLRGEYYNNDIRRHYNNTVGLKYEHFDSVNWEGICTATRKNINRNQMLKYQHNQWPTNERNHKWNISDSNVCQLCNTEVETWQHILKCSSVHATRQRTLSLVSIKKDLGLLKTCPELTEHILNIITDWSNDKEPSAPNIDFLPYRLEIRQAHFA